MERDPMLYEDLSYDRQSRQKVGAPAGVFLLDGGFHVACHGTRAASRLRERGAVLVADLLFDPPAAERAVSGGARHPYAPELDPGFARGAVRFSPAPERN